MSYKISKRHKIRGKYYFKIYRDGKLVGQINAKSKAQARGKAGVIERKRKEKVRKKKRPPKFTWGKPKKQETKNYEGKAYKKPVHAWFPVVPDWEHGKTKRRFNPEKWGKRISKLAKKNLGLRDGWDVGYVLFYLDYVSGIQELPRCVKTPHQTTTERLIEAYHETLMDLRHQVLEAPSPVWIFIKEIEVGFWKRK